MLVGKGSGLPYFFIKARFTAVVMKTTVFNGKLMCFTVDNYFAPGYPVGKAANYGTYVKLIVNITMQIIITKYNVGQFALVIGYKNRLDGSAKVGDMNF